MTDGQEPEHKGVDLGEHPRPHRTMAGMATPEQMAELAASAYSRQAFLQLMIGHHEGAVDAEFWISLGLPMTRCFMNLLVMLKMISWLR